MVELRNLLIANRHRRSLSPVVLIGPTDHSQLPCQPSPAAKNCEHAARGLLI